MIPGFPVRMLARFGQTIAEWPVASQQQSRRNAMVAATDCAQRRAEREDVAAYLAQRAGQRPVAAPSASSGRGARAHG